MLLQTKNTCLSSNVFIHENNVISITNIVVYANILLFAERSVFLCMRSVRFTGDSCFFYALRRYVSQNGVAFTHENITFRRTVPFVCMTLYTICRNSRFYMHENKTVLTLEGFLFVLYRIAGSQR